MEHFIGKTVKHDVLNAYGVTIVPAQTILNYESIQIMIKHKIDIESVVIVESSAIETIRSSELMQHTVGLSKILFESIPSSRKVPLMEFRKDVVPAIQQISENANIFDLFETIKARDEYTYQHNIGVGVLSTLIGKWMNLDESELSILTLAATLHDVGKVKIPVELLNKPGKLTDDEFQLVKKHTIYGYDLLKGTVGLSQRVALVALQHHEREDNRGYPLGLGKGQVDLFSSIVAVADIFHAMSSKRPYHDPLSFHEIIRQMSDGKFGALNPQIISVFIENVMKRLVGKRVVLTNNSQGEVVYLNPHSLETPLIKVKDHFLDLSQDRNIHIREIIA